MTQEEKNLPLSVLFPRNHAELYLPINLDGSIGKIVFQATHRELRKTMYWHLNEDYLGSTNRIHEFALSPPAGKHRLTVVDEDGNKLVRHFHILNKNDKAPEH